MEEEKVYGDGAIRWFYGGPWGRPFWGIFTGKLFSRLYGILQDSPLSKKKIGPFRETFGVNLEDFAPEAGREEDDPYSSFNQFFIRRFREGRRPFVKGDTLAAFAEGRYLGHTRVDDSLRVPVKGVYLNPGRLLKKRQWEETFREGPILIARLCPVDYHRFHFPDGGRLLDHYPLGGGLHSVNPLALKRKADIFLANERQISILETSHFGVLALIEIGALGVGKIVQSAPSPRFERGEEKGYFLFGGSTIILLGERGRWRPSEDVLHHTGRGIETYIRLGDGVGQGKSLPLGLHQLIS